MGQCQRNATVECERNTNVIRTHSDGNATNTNIRVIGNNARKAFIAPTPQETTDYGRSIGFELYGQANRLKKRRPAETGQKD